MKKAMSLLLFSASTCLVSLGHAGLDFDAAMLSYEKGDYAQALIQLRATARDGDARAQEILGFMYAAGAVLYPGVESNPTEALHWFKLAARNSRPVAGYMSCMLQRPSAANLAVAMPCPPDEPPLLTRKPSS